MLTHNIVTVKYFMSYFLKKFFITFVQNFLFKNTLQYIGLKPFLSYTSLSKKGNKINYFFHFFSYRKFVSDTYCQKAYILVVKTLFWFLTQNSNQNFFIFALDFFNSTFVKFYNRNFIFFTRIFQNFTLCFSKIPYSIQYIFITKPLFTKKNNYIFILNYRINT